LSEKLISGGQPCADFRNEFLDGAGGWEMAAWMYQKIERFPGGCVCLTDFDPTSTSKFETLLRKWMMV
jgi:hypothetical protein